MQPVMAHGTVPAGPLYAGEKILFSPGYYNIYTGHGGQRLAYTPGGYGTISSNPGIFSQIASFAERAGLVVGGAVAGGYAANAFLGAGSATEATGATALGGSGVSAVPSYASIAGVSTPTFSTATAAGPTLFSGIASGAKIAEKGAQVISGASDSYAAIKGLNMINPTQNPFSTPGVPSPGYITPGVTNPVTDAVPATASNPLPTATASSPGAGSYLEPIIILGAVAMAFFAFRKGAK